MEFWKIFLTAVITGIASNVIGYIKDKKFASSKYTERVLTEQYVPIYKILTERIVPGDGYDGIYEDQLSEIKEIIEKHPELTDPKLDSLIYGYFEDIYLNSNSFYTEQKEEEVIYDADRKLLDYILISFNKTRRSLGLPCDLKYAYPFLFRLEKSTRIFKSKYRRIRRVRQIRKIQKRVHNNT